MSKEEIIKEMDEIMPFHLNERLLPYIYEAMEIYKTQYANSVIEKLESLSVNYGVYDGVYAVDKINLDFLIEELEANNETK
jgi:hypothetical protein